MHIKHSYFTSKYVGVEDIFLHNTECVDLYIHTYIGEYRFLATGMMGMSTMPCHAMPWEG